jgi:hypothetical protein
MLLLSAAPTNWIGRIPTLLRPSRCAGFGTMPAHGTQPRALPRLTIRPNVSDLDAIKIDGGPSPVRHGVIESQGVQDGWRSWTADIGSPGGGGIVSLRSAQPIQIPLPSAGSEAPGLQAPDVPTDVLLAVPYYRQEQANWCWAACCEMLIDFYRRTQTSQCSMASTNFGLQCCHSPLPNGCDQGEWPENVYSRYGIDLSIDQHALSDADVLAELRAGCPLEVYYAWDGGGAHVALVVGRHSNGDYLVHDPWYGAGRRTGAAVRDGYGLGAWTMTYRTGAA